MDDLHQALNKLAFSEHFIRHSKRMGFRCPQDILDCPPAEVIRKEGFDHVWLEEWTAWLSERGAITRWQPLPGSNVP